MLIPGPGEVGQSLLLVLLVLGCIGGRLISGEGGLVVAGGALKLADAEMRVAQALALPVLVDEASVRGQGLFCIALLLVGSAPSCA